MTMIDSQHKVEVRDNMIIEWDAPIQMSDGLVLRADIFRPQDGKPAPAILTYGPYGKGLDFREGYKTAWDLMVKNHPDAVSGTSNKYANWEVVDPEKWVPDGYVCIRVDSRGAGRSPGYLAHNNRRESQDIYESIEWAAQQAWCSGKVGMNGISYYASNQWRAAALQPPHLAAICVWEGWSDAYRDGFRHGGIACTFRKNWQDLQVKTVQHGVGERGKRNPNTGELVCGPETLDDETLVKNREDMWGEILKRELTDEWYAERTPDLSKVVVPLLSAANWGGQGLHLRGNIEGFLAAGATKKWLEAHGHSHWAPFYTDQGVALQKQFFGYFLKGEKNGWEDQPPLMLYIRHPNEKFELRHEQEWPLARTQWTKFYLDPSDMQLSVQPPKPTKGATLKYRAMDNQGLQFLTAPMTSPMELTGPSALKIRVASSTKDADLFVILRVFDPAGNEVLFEGAMDPKAPISQGWLRASHRKVDPARSLPYRPWHTHDEKQPLDPGVFVDLDIEIWPTCIVIPEGFRLGIQIKGTDFDHGLSPASLSNVKYPMRGCGPFIHDDENDRPPSVFDNEVTVSFDQENLPYVLLPVIPKR
jgi:uncharacterized protein